MRPVIASGTDVDPSKETRDRLILDEDGLITVTGGKLTTFRSSAVETLKRAAARVPELKGGPPDVPLFAPPAAATVDALHDAPQDLSARWLARYGDEAAGVKNCAGPGEQLTIRHTGAAWAELRWRAAPNRSSISTTSCCDSPARPVVAERPIEFLSRVKAIAEEELGWSEIRWNAEVTAYRDLIARCYSVPGARHD